MRNAGFMTRIECSSNELDLSKRFRSKLVIYWNLAMVVEEGDKTRVSGQELYWLT